MKQLVVSGAFDDLRADGVRFLEEASKLGRLTVLLWSDEAVNRFTGAPPKFPAPERSYLLNALRFVERVELSSGLTSPEALSELPGVCPDVWAVHEAHASAAKETFCRARGIGYHLIRQEQLGGFPVPEPLPSAPGRKKVVVTGCYDWFHSGHVRFFEEVSHYGDLHVIVGHDANIRLLKGEGHPLLGQDVRRYMVASVKHVKQALISTGNGWLDADPEIQRLKPDIYAVNEDGDKGGKREYCAEHGIEYLVLTRTPSPGLRARTSTDLRGF